MVGRLPLPSSFRHATLSAASASHHRPRREPTAETDCVTDRELVARVLAGDPAAERALYDAHVERAYRLAFRMTGDGDLAQDVVQETCIRAYRQPGTCRVAAARGAWLA